MANKHRSTAEEQTNVFTHGSYPLAVFAIDIFVYANEAG